MDTKYAWLVLIGLILIVGACSDAANNNPRFVDQKEINNEFIPLGDVDDSVRNSAKASISTIVRPIQEKFLTKYGEDFGKLKADLNNTNGAQLLTKLGLSPTLLNNTHYKSTDFHFTFNAGKMHVVAMPGKDRTRGHFTADYSISK